VLRALLFDFNGVLVDDEPLHFRLFRGVLADEGVELTEAAYWSRYLGFDDRDCLAAALADAGRPAPPALVARLIARKAARYQEEIRRDGYPFFAGAVDLVRSAAGAGLALAVVSGALRDEVEGALREAGLLEVVRTIVSAEDVERGKPDPEGYRRALEALNVEVPGAGRLIHPHEAVAIEDSPAGLEAAAEAGLRAVGVAQSYPREALAAADWVVGAVAELSVERLRERFDGD
jgi:HAD superfamily hydrolase (TIGR01509 family)